MSPIINSDNSSLKSILKSSKWNLLLSERFRNLSRADKMDVLPVLFLPITNDNSSSISIEKFFNNRKFST